MTFWDGNKGSKFKLRVRETEGILNSSVAQVIWARSMPDACTDAHVYLPVISNFTNSSSIMQCTWETLRSRKQWQRSQAKENVSANNYLCLHLSYFQFKMSKVFFTAQTRYKVQFGFQIARQRSFNCTKLSLYHLNIRMVKEKWILMLR